MNESTKPPGKQTKDYSSYAFGERNRPRKTKNVWMMSRHSSRRCKFTLKAHARMPQRKSTWNSEACAYANNC